MPQSNDLSPTHRVTFTEKDEDGNVIETVAADCHIWEDVWQNAYHPDIDVHTRKGAHDSICVRFALDAWLQHGDQVWERNRVPDWGKLSLSPIDREAGHVTPPRARMQDSASYEDFGYGQAWGM